MNVIWCYRHVHSVFTDKSFESSLLICDVYEKILIPNGVFNLRDDTLRLNP